MTATPVLEVDTSLGYPPVVGITVTAADAETVTVSRVTVDGPEPLVNGRDIGISGAAYIEDYTAPFGVPTQYVAVAKDSAGVESSESAPTVPVTVQVYGSTGLWLTDPTLPASAIEVRVADWDERDYDTESSLALPLGGTNPVALLATRQRPAFTLTTTTSRREQRDELKQLLGSSPLLLLRPTPILEEPARYCMVGKVKERRLTIGRYQYEIDLTECRPPAIAVKYGAPGRRYMDVVYYYDSYTDPKLEGRTYLDMAKDPRP